MKSPHAAWAVLLAVLSLTAARPAEAQDAAPAAEAPVSAPLQQVLDPPPPPPAVVPTTVDVLLRTPLGNIRLALDKDRAPVTVANFLRYVDAKRFDGISFYRAVKVDAEGSYGLVQGGLRGNPKRAFKPIAHESPAQTGLSHTDGAISMARTAPGTATGDFFIVVGDLVSLDGTPDGKDPGYAVFGRVTEGMELVRQMLLMPRADDAGDGSMQGQILASPLQITSVLRVLRAP